ncbi:hypothetical protein [Streptomyces sp. NRRL S-646]|uniref:hypothetical protein n=1 Tax=Streptomyces sp. NRRL S-646 TaxID=1463917 RepID=UPI0004C5A3B7|nr:hypothetical protein [Streptomyces sp. NRRL S-646]
MSATPRQLPAAAIPDGCPPWEGMHTRRWTQASAPRWVPVRVPLRVILLVDLCALLAACGLADWGVQPFAAAFLALQVVWLLVRPEIVRITAALQVLVVVVLPVAPSAWVVPCAVVLAGVSALAAQLRMEARKRQSDAALAASGGVTAPVPQGQQWRGRFFNIIGVVLVVAGTASAVAARDAGAVDDRRVALAAGFFLAGLGLTALLSGILGRRRSAALRREPAPVLRVLVRAGGLLDTQVFAADDVGALRPLFTVSLTEVDGKDGKDGRDDEDLTDDDPGPLREAVLYGAPYDGAEVLLVCAAEKPGEEPTVERSIGPVRPLSDSYVRVALRVEKSRAARDAVYEERSRAAAETVARAPYAVAGKGVRRWRSGWADWLTAAMAVAGAVHFAWNEDDVWWYGVGGILGLVAVRVLPKWLAWRITADRDGLWFNGLWRARHIAWDDLRLVECKGQELKIDSRGPIGEWSVIGFRWAWLERKLGFVHPYERAAAEITAMWREPAYRPFAAAGERERRRLLWPVAVLVALVWAAGLILA